jgi:hypothetical protein
MLVQAAAHPTDPARRKVLRRPTRQWLVVHAVPRKHRAARARHAAVAKVPVEPFGSPGHVGATAFGGWLEVVSTKALAPETGICSVCKKA